MSNKDRFLDIFEWDGTNRGKANQRPEDSSKLKTGPALAEVAPAEMEDVNKLYSLEQYTDASEFRSGLHARSGDGMPVEGIGPAEMCNQPSDLTCLGSRAICQF